MAARDFVKPLSPPRAHLLSLALLLLGTGAAPASGQKDYYNTDRNRPVRIEDAYPAERYALEVKVAPIRLERMRGGQYHWSLHPEVGYGVLPRTSIEIGVPISFIDDGAGGRRWGLAGVEFSSFHRLNAETRTLPALGVRVDVGLPVGSLGPRQVRPSATALATRTLRWMRVNVNARYRLGDDSGVDDAGRPGTHEAGRWLAGVAIDRAFPLSALLITASVHRESPVHAGDPPAWDAGAGVRYQVSPYIAVDAGLGHSLTGERGWYVTFGSAYHVGIRALMPPRR